MQAMDHRLGRAWRVAVIAAPVALLLSAPAMAQAQTAGATVDGAATYVSGGCAACHQADGGGVAGVYPKLSGRVAAIAQSEPGRRYLVDVVSFGMLGTIDVDGESITGLMPAHGEMSDAAVASTLTWLAGLQPPPGAKPQQFTPAFVHEVRQQPLGPDAVLKLRAKVLPEK